ncbi:MAG: type II toxin-antitoxin system CcdA family antitoxin [Actinomycetota bacterium]|nr:type II toxin-antitoxin system CcdA family antitoxin [Actinomycetota bacterium]
MARVNVYLPDDLADAAREAGLNVSNIAQEALRDRLRAKSTSAWLDRVALLPVIGVSRQQIVAALDAARAEQGDEWPDAAPADTR